MTTQPQVDGLPGPSTGPVARPAALRSTWQQEEVALRAPHRAPEFGDEPQPWSESSSHVSLHAKLILLIDEMAFTRECTVRCLAAVCPEIPIIPFAGIQECIDSRLGTGRACVILYNVHAAAVGEPLIGDGLKRLQAELAPFPVVILSDVDRADYVREAFQRGARGYIPTTSTTLDVAAEVIRLVRVGGTFMPASGVGTEPGGRNGERRGGVEGQFTPRQIAVLNHLRQGKANKIIAHELQMSESTVKVHVRNIMKKMKATNRTEVAFRAQSLRSIP